jgi:hypothetical protein
MSGSCEALPGKFPPRVCRRMLRIFVFCVAATAPAVTSRIGEERVDVATERVNAALDGLQKYFFDAKGQFWNAVCSSLFECRLPLRNSCCAIGITHTVALRSICAVRTKWWQRWQGPDKLHVHLRVRITVLQELLSVVDVDDDAITHVAERGTARAHELRPDHAATRRHA